MKVNTHTGDRMIYIELLEGLTLPALQKARE